VRGLRAADHVIDGHREQAAGAELGEACVEQPAHGLAALRTEHAPLRGHATAQRGSLPPRGRARPDRRRLDRGLPDRGWLDRGLADQDWLDRGLADQDWLDRRWLDRGLLDRGLPDRSLLDRGLPDQG
jgi:hypothetical protein